MTNRPGPVFARRRGLAVLALAAAAVLGGAVPASAHALLQTSNPVAGSSVPSGPRQVTLTYSESVSVSADSVQVLNGAGQRVDQGRTHHGRTGSEVVTALRPGLAKGTYVVSWRAVSADSHPVAGAFTFGVGVTPDASAAARIGQRAGSDVVGALDGVARLASEAGVALALGGGLFLLVLWPPGRYRAGPRRVVWGGWTAALVGSVALLLLEGPYGSGLGLSAAFRGSVLSATLDTRYGQLTLLRVVLLLVAVPVLYSLMPRDPDAAAAAEDHRFGQGEDRLYERVALAELAVVGVAIAATLAGAGHAGVSGLAPLATASLTLHVLAVSIWVGGLVLLAGFVLRSDGPTLARLLPRWSRVAMAAVAVVVATGVFQSWREVRGWGALTGTTYGRLLLVKIGLVALMLVAAAFANRWVARRYRTVVFAAQDAALRGSGSRAGAGRGGGGDDASVTGPGVGYLRAGVGFETVLAAGVLAVTAVLVNAPPARTAYAPPFSRTVVSGPLTAHIDVSPTRSGAERFKVEVTDRAGKPRTVQEVSGQLRLPSRGVGPLPVRFNLAGSGLAIADGVAVPFTGTWKLTVTIRVDDFDQYSATVTYRVR